MSVEVTIRVIAIIAGGSHDPAVDKVEELTKRRSSISGENLREGSPSKQQRHMLCGTTCCLGKMSSSQMAPVWTDQNFSLSALFRLLFGKKIFRKKFLLQRSSGEAEELNMEKKIV